MTDLFENGKPKEDGTPAVTPPAGAETTDTYLGLILNEQGEQKYATAEEALKGSVHAQAHITNLESELKELRLTADKGANIDQIVEALKERKEGDPAPTPAGISAEDVATQVEQLLVKRDAETTTQANITTVTGVFSKLYGDKASETMYGKAEDLGFSKDEINSMIATNPTATLKILGVGTVKPKVGDPVVDAGGVSAEHFSGEKPPETPASIMGATNSNALTDSWKESQARTNKRLGVEVPA